LICGSQRAEAKIEHMTLSLEMTDYELHYWSVPFRGQFVRAVLAYAGKTGTEGGDDAIARLMEGTVTHMPVRSRPRT
jgi:hypothetical protein